ncbi:MAG: hypothetical protein E5V86_09855 [Mesorhizobium sp.]|nr:MAG: hypothetical protein E5V86_09855 [Mesorhizobium sp.]
MRAGEAVRDLPAEFPVAENGPQLRCVLPENFNRDLIPEIVAQRWPVLPRDPVDSRPEFQSEQPVETIALFYQEPHALICELKRLGREASRSAAYALDAFAGCEVIA